VIGSMGTVEVLLNSENIGTVLVFTVDSDCIDM